MTVRPGERPGLPGLFSDMAATCARVEAPTYADLAEFVAGEVQVQGALQTLLSPYATARISDMVPLRFFAAVQRLVLDRRAPGLAIFYANVGGTPPASERARAACRAALLDTVGSHAVEIARGLCWFPQTNEVGRTASLAAILREVHRAWGLPVSLHEIGASAGLSLRVDALVAAGVVPAENPDWGAMPVIAERGGCDVSPIDALTTEGRMTLTSYIWPDHLDRFERLRAALDVAGRIAADLCAQDAVAYVRGLRLGEGLATVVWHSAMWPYLSPDDRAEIEYMLADLGSRASARAPLVHVALEPTSEASGEQHVFRLRVSSWPGMGGVPTGLTVTKATTPPSGLPVSWAVPCVGGIIRDDAGRLLVVRRGHAPAAGQWSIPGGRIEEGESQVDAVAREVLEETGIAVIVGELAGVVDRDAGSGTTYVIYDYVAAPREWAQPVAGDDAADARWVTLSQLRELHTTPGLIEALADWDCLPA